MEFLVEFFIQLVFEILAELGFRLLPSAVRERFGKVFLFSMIYFFLAMIFAMASLAIFPEHLIRDERMRMLNLFATPLLIGIIFGYWGKILRAKDKVTTHLDTFIFAFVFALTFGVVRYILAT